MNHRPTFVEIDLGAIAHNLTEIENRVAPAGIMAVVKANAYGHGLSEIAAAASNQVSYFGVALPEEGIVLRASRISKPILVLGGFFAEQAGQFFEYDLEATLYDLARARVLSRKAQDFGKPARVHIKVDTGMGRVGVDWPDAAEFAQRVNELSGLETVGIYTHFASSDSLDRSFAQEQLQRFRQVLAELERRNIRIPLRHAANSGAVLDLPDSYFDMVRTGIAVYGYRPSCEANASLPLKPAMTLKSRVLAVREAPAGTPVSYGSTHRTASATRLAVVPVGYGDGYNRLLSNQGEVLISGRRRRIAGTVCMDQIVVDVGASGDVQTGDEVVLLGRQGGEEIAIYDICQAVNTIPYEVTCWISERVPRVYKR